MKKKQKKESATNVGKNSLLKYVKIGENSKRKI